MPVLTDRQITRLCNKPTHMLYDRFGFGVCLITEPYTEEEERAIANFCSDIGQVYGNEEEARPVEDVNDWVPMISPFHPELIRKVGDQKVISYGISSMGYDVSLSGKELKLFTNLFSAEIDPMEIDVDKCFVDPQVRTCPKKGLEYVLLPPNSYLLGHTVEYFNIPRDILTICLGKSTYARAAIAVNVTPIEPGFSGTVVLEIANLTNLPARVYLNMGISQFIFLKADEECSVSYADRGGKYQGQTGLTHAKV